jgi:hypothetical protein
MSNIGDEVQVKDEVYVLHYGKGRVASRTPDDGGFNVEFPDHKVMHFSRSGCQGASARRLVFWHNPILAEPPRDKILWDGFARLAVHLYGEVAKWRAGGWPDGS